MAIGYRDCLIARITPAAPGAGNTDHIITRPFRLDDVSVVATAIQAGGTVQILRQTQGAGAFNALTDAIACTTVNAVTRLGTLNGPEQSFAIGDVLRLTVAAAATNGVISALIEAMPVSGQS